MEFLQYFLHQNLRILSRDQYVLIDGKGQSHKVLLPGQLLQRNVLRPLSDPAKIFLFRFRCHQLFPVHQQIITIRTAYRFQQKSRIQCGFFDSRCLQSQTALFIAFPIGHLNPLVLRMHRPSSSSHPLRNRRYPVNISSSRTQLLRKRWLPLPCSHRAPWWSYAGSTYREQTGS